MKHSILLLIFISLSLGIFAQSPDVILQADQASAFFGISVSSAGDVNGDGYDDIITGALYYDNGQTDEGAAFIYYGSSSGISTIPSVVLEGNQDNANFGYRVSSAGDVNGDGYDDIIVGAYNYDNGQTNEGRVFIYHGSPSGIITTPAQTMESDQAGANFGFSVSGAGDVNGDGYDDVIVGADAFDNGQTDEGKVFIYHGSASGILSVAAFTFESNQVGAFLGNAVSGVGDVNGDGYGDIIAGGYYYDNGQTNEGRAYIYYGSSTGLSAAAFLTLESNQSNAYFGVSVSEAGDVNGDGFDDVIIGAQQYDNIEIDEGRAYIYHGSSSGLSVTPTLTLESNSEGAYFGGSVSGAGDVDHDGYDDIIVGAYLYSNFQNAEGKSYIYRGSPTGVHTFAAQTMEGNQVTAELGSSVACAGDVNGDGYDDIIIGAFVYDNGQSNEGNAFIYYGKSCTTQILYSDADDDGFGNPLDTVHSICTAFEGYIYSAGDCNDTNEYVNVEATEILDGLDNNCNDSTDEGFEWSVGAILEGNQADALFGIVSNAGDVNADGYDDLLIGAWQYDNAKTDAGRAYVYNGSSTGIGLMPATIIEGDSYSGNFGASVSGAGDINGDGYDDIIVGAYDVASRGFVYIYYGSPTGVNTAIPLVLDVGQSNAFFGACVSGAGDVNKDGYDDIIIGALLYDNGQTNEGRAYIYYGTASGLNTTTPTILENNQAYSNFSVSVSDAGDINGDGYDDIIIGANLFDNGQTNEGAAYIFYGSSTGINTTPAIILESNQASSGFGISVSGAGDINADGFDDIIIGANYFDNGQTDEGRVFIYAGSASGISATPLLTLENNEAGSYFGYSVSEAGDFNDDAYSDIIIGAYGFDRPENVEGAIYAYNGSGSGLETTPALFVESNEEHAAYGLSVSKAGDLNGDGHDDIVIGAQDYENPEVDEGAAYIYYSHPCNIDFFADADGDGFGDADVRISACVAPAGYVSDSTDCNDSNMSINPASAEVCNLLDDDCNGLSDDGIIEAISITAGGPVTFCQGGSVFLTAIYTGSSVQWKRNGINIPGATASTYSATQKGTYTCLTTSSCGTDLSETIMVNVQKNPMAAITAGGPTTFCAGGSVVLTANTGGGLSYQWYKGATAITGATGINYTATVTGNYKCRVTKTATGCFKNSNTINVSVPCKEGAGANNNLIVYPNPTDENVMVSYALKLTGSEIITITIYNIAGEIIFERSWDQVGTDFQQDISLHDYPAGMYTLQLKSGETDVFEKIIKQ